MPSSHIGLTRKNKITMINAYNVVNNRKSIILLYFPLAFTQTPEQKLNPSQGCCQWDGNPIHDMTTGNFSTLLNQQYPLNTKLTKLIISLVQYLDELLPIFMIHIFELISIHSIPSTRSNTQGIDRSISVRKTNLLLSYAYEYNMAPEPMNVQ